MAPHATADMGTERRRSSSAHTKSSTFKFPDFAQQELDVAVDEENTSGISRGPSPMPLPNGLPPGLHSSERWLMRRGSKPNNWSIWSNGTAAGTRHGRQKSLSEAIRTVRTRKASISETAVEIADSLKAPISFRLIMLCAIWYSASILSNTSSKAILTVLPRPITLTIMQFLLVSFWCIFLSWLAKHNSTIRNAMPVLRNGIRRPSKDIIVATLPLTAFQIGGHILNSDAMARIPVSLVHTIKGLSPLMTVFAYRVFLDRRYSLPTYLSLIPLTSGVIMACSASFAGNFIGLTYAFGSAILFVTQNIVSKKIFDEAAKAELDGAPIGRRKPDKLNLLCYSSAMSLLITFPIWLWSEGFSIAADYFADYSIELREKPGSLDHGALALEFLFNGTFHFGQSLVAFVLLGMVSPVTYSVASLIKRVAVILFAIVWFGSPMTTIQEFGFVLTFLGLYLYDRTSDAAKADKRATHRVERPLLPLNTGDAKRDDSVFVKTPTIQEGMESSFNSSTAMGNADPGASGPGRPISAGMNGSTTVTGGAAALPLGTKAEDTWNPGDGNVKPIMAGR